MTTLTDFTPDEIKTGIAQNKELIAKCEREIAALRALCPHPIPLRVQRVINYANERWVECSACGSTVS